MNSLLLIFFVSIFSLFADVVLKKAADKNSYLLLAAGCILYMLDGILWFVAYKYSKFSTVAIVYSIFIILLSVLIGIFYFKEKINSVEIIGIVLGFASIFLLSRFK
jgi:drug/metabolite transporter (DMT)-like permease